MIVNTDNFDLHKTIPSHVTLDNTTFLCVGTDRSTGDSLAPLIGSKLKELGYENVIGTLENPVHAQNVQEIASEIKTKNIIGIGAALGENRSIGKIHCREKPLKPGVGVGKKLGKYGNYSITGVVNVGGFMEYFVLQNTRLSYIVEMADVIVDGITDRFPLEKVSFWKRVRRISRGSK